MPEGIFKIRDSLGLLRQKRRSYAPVRQEATISCRLPAIKQINATDELKWQIKALPENWVPNTKPSNVVAHFFKVKEVQHEESVKKMKDNMVKTNIDVEHEIRKRAELLMSSLQQHENFIEECLGNIDIPEDINVFPKGRNADNNVFSEKHAPIFAHVTPLVPKRLFKPTNGSGTFGHVCPFVDYKSVVIPKETFDEVIEHINSATYNSLALISELHMFFLNLEKDRSDKFKAILKESYGEMCVISHKLPFQLQEFFELEILNINQITLNNYRAYEELKMQIMLKVENDKRLWLQRLLDKKNEYVYRKKLILKEKYKGRLSVNLDVFARMSMEQYNPVYDGNDIITMDSIDMIANALAKFLMNFDKDVKMIKVLTDTTIKKIYDSNYDEVHNINPDIINIQSDYELSDLKAAVLSSFFDNSNELNDFSVSMIANWDEFRDTLQAALYDNLKVFTSAIHLWDEHYMRIFELQELTIIDLKKLIEKNHGWEGVQFCKVNVFVDKLRQASSEGELKQLMGDIQKCLNNIMKTAESNHQKELAFFDKYKNFAENETSIFLSEIQMFLSHYSKNADIDPTKQRGRASQTNLVRKTQIPIRLQFENVLKSLHNWIFGLHECIQISTEKYKQNFIESAIKWTEHQCIYLHRKWEIKNILYKPKFQRIYEYIYKVRLAELKQHDERLERHKMAINDEIELLKRTGNEKQSQYESVVDEVADQLPDYDARVGKVKTAIEIELLINQLQNTKNMNVNKMAEMNEEFSSEIADFLNDIKCMNLNYLKCLKLFNEGGNYSPAEIKKFKRIFNKLSKKMSKDVQPAVKQFSQKNVKSVAALDAKMQPTLQNLLQVKEELDFHEHIIFEIKDVRSKIRDLTYNLKYKYAVIDDLFRQLIQCANYNKGSLSYLQEFIENCEYLESAFQEVQVLLVQDHPFKLNPQLFREDVLMSSTSLKSTLTSLAENDNVQYNMILFDSVNQGSDYITSVVDLLYTSLTDVQNRAREFYKNHKTFIKESLIIPNLKTFMLELLSKYLYYEIQCEEVWLEVAVDYMVKVEDVLQFVRSYYKSSIKKNVNTQIEDVKKTCVKFMVQVNNQNEDVENSYKALYKKLKPLHGHPKNAALLQALEDELVEVNENVLDVQDQMTESYEYFKEKIETNLDTFENELWETEGPLKDNLDHYVSLIVNDRNLLQQIKGRIEYLGTFISSDYFTSSSSEKYTNIILELNTKLNELKKGLHITSECLMKFSNSIINVAKLADELSYDDPITSTASSSYVNVVELIKLYRDQQEMCIMKLNFSKNLSVTSEKWNEQWKSDVEKVKNLYTVKYTEAQLRRESNNE